MAKLSYLGHVLTENRHGLVVDVELSEANGRTARDAALHMVERSDRDRLRRLLVAALQDALHAESPGARPEERRGAGRDDGAHDLPAALGGGVHAQHARVGTAQLAILALEFPDPPADRPYVIADMVASSDGKTVIEGDETGIGSRTDRRLLHELRLHADVVLTGAGTLRATGASPRLHEADLEALRVQRGRLGMTTVSTVSDSVRG